MKLLQWIRVFGCSNTIFSFTPTWLGIILNTRKEMHDKKKKKKRNKNKKKKKKWPQHREKNAHTHAVITAIFSFSQREIFNLTSFDRPMP